MTSKVGSVIKLVPVLIGGAYSASPALLPTPPEEMEELLKERECYTVTTIRNDQNTAYLLACRTKNIGQSLDFFYYSPPSTFKNDEAKGIAIPVKYLTDAGGDTESEKSFNLSFTYGGSTNWKTNAFNLVWMDGVQKEWYLINFCEKTEFVKFKGYSDTKILNCSWRNANNGKTGIDYWKEFDAKKIIFSDTPQITK